MSSSASDHPLEFTINPQTGAIVTIKTLDREAVSGYLLTVTAKDGGNPPLSDTTDIEISVSDVNDNPPLFKQQSYTGNILEDALIGRYYLVRYLDAGLRNIFYSRNVCSTSFCH